MSRFSNSGKSSFLASIPSTSVEAENNTLAEKCKFNFAYFDVQPAGQSFADWTEEQRLKLFDKLRDFSRESLLHWRSMPSGKKSGSVLAIYGGFPKNSDFQHPKHVPHEVEWGRFRLESAVRLIGFVLPNRYQNVLHATSGKPFDCNTFYVVFLDADHRFYRTGEGK